MKLLLLLTTLLTATQPGIAQDKDSPVSGEKATQPELRPPGHPNPMMARSHWSSLDGLWDYSITAKDAKEAQAWEGTTNIPAAVGSSLSGIKRESSPREQFWFHRKFPKPEIKPGSRSHLRFDGVSGEAQVWVNGTLCMAHQGTGHFHVDVTELLSKEGEQDLIVSSSGAQARSEIGITGSVWLETVSTTHFDDLDISTNVETGEVTLRAQIWGQVNFRKMEVIALDGRKEQATTIAPFDFKKHAYEASLTIPEFRSWSPESPKLYHLRIRLLSEDGTTLDEVTSYCAFRKIANSKDPAGQPQFSINDKPVPILGVEDSRNSAALSDAEIRTKIESIKAKGFNLIRRPNTFDCPRFYYWADHLGLLVWQQLPALQGGLKEVEAKKQHHQERAKIVRRFNNHPSIAIWQGKIGRGKEKIYIAGSKTGDLIYTKGLTLPANAKQGAALAATGLEPGKTVEAQTQLLAEIQKLRAQGLSAAVLTEAPTQLPADR